MRKIVVDKGVAFGDGGLVFIAGPCVIESRAMAISGGFVHDFRPWRSCGDFHLLPILMRKFLLKTLGFAALVLVLAFGLDLLICRGLLKMDDYRFQDYSAMIHGGMDNDILIMGNSRGKSHFDTRVIDSLSHKSSFNLGIGGYPINAQLLKYQLYREHNRKPELIIQNIDYMTVQVMSDIRN